MTSKKNADTTKMSPEEISRLNLHGAKRPPGQFPGGVLHQTGGPGTGKYPVALAVILVVAGLGSWTYFRSTHPDKGGQAHSHSPAVQSAAKEDNHRGRKQSSPHVKLSTKTG